VNAVKSSTKTRRWSGIFGSEIALRANDDETQAHQFLADLELPGWLNAPAMS
jgi:hypothetical protein